MAERVLRPDPEDAHGIAEALARDSYGKLIALLSSRTRDVVGAEDALSEAFAAALVDWPSKGIPRSPEAWILTVARRRQIDRARHERTAREQVDHVRWVAEELAAREPAEFPDERLSLMFACAHPALDPAIRAPLILQTILGFDAATIASAFLVSPATMSQRLVRAKRKIREAGIPFEIPGGPDLAPRLGAVLEAIYAVYSEGWLDPAGIDPRRRSLAQEAIGLGRVVAALLPDNAEALGLLALMLYAHARRDARRDESGEYVPLMEQDPARWDAALIEEAEALLTRASTLPGSGRFQLEAAVQSAHGARRQRGTADWPAIAALYDVLFALTGSPVVEINRAVALAEVSGAGAGLSVLDRLLPQSNVQQYQPFWAARADLLARTGDRAAAEEAYVRAIGLESDPAVRRYLTRRRERLSETAAPRVDPNPARSTEE